jgi:hypothetical protein
MRLLYDIILAYDLIGGSISRHSLPTDVENPVATTTWYETSTMFAMVCSSIQPYIVFWVDTSHS